MKKKSTWLLKTSLIITILMILILPSVVAAPMAQQGLFGDLLDKLTITLEKFLTYDIRIPHPYPLSGSYDEVVPLWSIFAVFTLLFAIIFAASAKIKIFDEEHKGARKAFSISLALIVVFGSPITELLVITFAGYVVTLGSLLVIVGLLIGLWFVLFIFPHRAISHGARALDEGTKIRGEKKLEAVEGKRISQEAGLIEKDLKRERKGFKKLWGLLDKERKAIGDLKNHLIKIREEINLIERLRGEPSKAADVKQRIVNELSSLIPIIDSERKIDERAEKINEKVEKFEYRNLRLFKGESRDLHKEEDIMRNLEKRKAYIENKDEIETHRLEAYIAHAYQDAKAVIHAEKRIEEILNEFNESTGKLKHFVREASEEVGRNNFRQAISLINEAIEILRIQDKLVEEVKGLELSVKDIERQVFNIEEFTKRAAKGLTVKVMNAKPTKQQLQDK